MTVKTIFRGVGLALIATTLAVLPMAKAQAQSNMDVKPAVVISIASIDEQIADVKHIMRAADMEAWGEIAASMAEQYIENFDSTEPAGAYVLLDTGTPQIVGFVPVEDLDEVLDLFREELGDIDEVDGMKVVSTPDGQKVYMKESKGFAFLSNLAENLESLPDNPTGLLGDMAENYNFAARFYAQNVPDELKQMAIGYMEMGFDEAMSALEEIDPAQAEFQRKMNAMSMESMVEMIEQTDQLTIGMAIDDKTSSTYVDFTITALPDSKLARQVELLKGATSKFAGFAPADAAASMHFLSKMTEDDIAIMEGMFDQMTDQIMTQIEEEAGDLDPMELDMIEEAVGSVMDVMQATVKGGTLDGGASLELSEDTVAIAGGMMVAEGGKLNRLFDQMIEWAEEEAPPEAEFEVETERMGDVTLKVVTLPIPEFEDEARDIFGEEVTIIMGASDDAAYFAAGKNAMAYLEKCVEESKQLENKEVPSAQLTIALAPILEFAASVDGNPVAIMMAETIEGSKNDKLRMISTTVENGARTRIEIQDDVIKLIGSAAAQFGGGFGPGF